MDPKPGARGFKVAAGQTSLSVVEVLQMVRGAISVPPWMVKLHIGVSGGLPTMLGGYTPVRLLL